MGENRKTAKSKTPAFLKKEKLTLSLFFSVFFKFLSISYGHFAQKVKYALRESHSRPQ
jgi:hypothetical protein